MSKNIIIVGSYSVGLFFNGKRIPNPGETVTAEHFFETFGGKGSNQAVTAAKLGGTTKLICKIGCDRYAEDAVSMYRKVGLYSESILQDRTTSTSVGSITVDENGNNAIIICLGANMNLHADEVMEIIRKEKDKPFIVGFQLENDVNMVMDCIRDCAELGINTLLDPAPAAPLPDWIYPCLTYIKPNEHEAAALSGIAIHSADDAFRAGRWFVKAGVRTAIITLGANGTVLVTKQTERYFETIKTNAVDTTGAGDVFSGALMKAMAEGMAVEDAILYANCAASLSVTKPGVTESIPAPGEVSELFTRKKREGGLNRA
jgi:ribokinase